MGAAGQQPAGRRGAAAAGRAAVVSGEGGASGAEGARVGRGGRGWPGGSARGVWLFVGGVHALCTLPHTSVRAHPPPATPHSPPHPQERDFEHRLERLRREAAVPREGRAAAHAVQSAALRLLVGRGGVPRDEVVWRTDVQAKVCTRVRLHACMPCAGVERGGGRGSASVQLPSCAGRWFPLPPRAHPPRCSPLPPPPPTRSHLQLGVVLIKLLAETCKVEVKQRGRTSMEQAFWHKLELGAPTNGKGTRLRSCAGWGGGGGRAYGGEARAKGGRARWGAWARREAWARPCPPAP